MKTITLQQLKRQIIDSQAQRDEMVDRGRRAFRLGIEMRDCPVGEEGGRKLWMEGYKKAAEQFNSEKQQRW